MHKATILSLAR